LLRHRLLCSRIAATAASTFTGHEKIELQQTKNNMASSCCAKFIKISFRQSALNLHKTTFSQKQHAAMLEDEIDKTVTMLYRSRSRGEFDLGAEDCSLPSLCQDL